MVIVMSEKEFSDRVALNKKIEYEDQWFPPLEKLEEITEEKIPEQIDYLIWCATKDEKGLDPVDLEAQDYAKKLLKKYVRIETEETIRKIKQAKK